MSEELTRNDLKRYNRHVILDEVGLAGQEKIKAAKVLVIGAGGLGSPALQYLAAAGVGTIGIVDFDYVDLSNLQRQILFTPADIGKNKAVVASERLKQLNDSIEIIPYAERLTTKNALGLFQQFDIIVDGTDNFSTRYLVNDAALLTEKPLVYGSIYKFQGQISVFNYKNGPSYRCLFPEPPAPGTIKNCSEIGVIGVLPGVIGTQQANEALKIILEIGEVQSGKLMLYDALTAMYSTINIQVAQQEIDRVKAMSQQDFELMDYDLFCGIKNELSEHEIDANTLRSWIDAIDIRIIDLREEWEEPALEGTNVERITMNAILHQINRFITEKKVVLVCQTGIRSNQVRILLEQEHQLNNIVELKGGMESYDKKG